MTEDFVLKLNFILGKGWGIEDDNEKSHLSSPTDISRVKAINRLKEGESRIDGAEKIRRHNGSYDRCLGVKDCEYLIYNQSYILKNWSERIDGNTQFLFCDRTIFHSKNRSYIIGLNWNVHLGQYGLCSHSLKDHLSRYCFSLSV